MFGLELAVNATNTPVVVLGRFPRTNTNNKTVSGSIFNERLEKMVLWCITIAFFLLVRDLKCKKKDLGNAFFSEFCVDPCLADFFFTVFISKFRFSKTMSHLRDKNRGFGLVLRKTDL